MTWTASLVPFSCAIFCWQFLTLCRSFCTRMCSESTCAKSLSAWSPERFRQLRTHPGFHLVKDGMCIALQLFQCICNELYAVLLCDIFGHRCEWKAGV